MEMEMEAQTYWVIHHGQLQPFYRMASRDANMPTDASVDVRYWEDLDPRQAALLGIWSDQQRKREWDEKTPEHRQRVLDTLTVDEAVETLYGLTGLVASRVWPEPAAAEAALKRVREHMHFPPFAATRDEIAAQLKA